MNLIKSKVKILIALLLLGCASAKGQDVERAPLDKPNIVFILADDLAWADVAYNGHPFFETPNIDKFVKDGVNLDQMYSGGPNCMPTRACLITGMYAPRTDVYTPGGESKGNKSYMRLAVPGTNDLGNSQFKSQKKGLSKRVTSVRRRTFAEVLPSGTSL